MGSRRRRRRPGRGRTDGQGRLGTDPGLLARLPRSRTRGIDVAAIDADLHEVAGVVEIHDLHVWEVTSGFPALSAHILVEDDRDCHERREAITSLLRESYEIDHTTLQVDHAAPAFVPTGDVVHSPRKDDPR